jgi:branched-chain amino acid aminotransferase
MPPKEKLLFGVTTSDHLLSVDWHDETGWTAPSIAPYGPLSLDPTCSVFH